MKKLTLIIHAFFISLSLFSNDMIFNTLHNPPLEINNNHKLDGALSEIVREAVKLTGKSVTIEYKPWKRAQYNTKAGLADACFNTGINNNRKTWAYFHDEVLFMETYVLFIRSDSSVKIPEDFKNVTNLKVGVQRGYTYGGEFQKALNDKRFNSILETDSIKQNIKMLISGRIDFFIGDRIPTKYFLTQENVSDRVEIFQNSDGEDLIVSLWPTYVAFSKKTVPLSYVIEFNTALKELKKNGIYERIFEKYIK